MIAARHRKWSHFIFKHYLDHIFKKYFHSMKLMGDPPYVNPQLPLILVPNHSSWWDGFFVYHLNRVLLHRRMYLMMLEDQLAKFPFFSLVGCFSIKPGSPKGISHSLNYTSALLEAPEAGQVAICLFPQGELQPWGKRPLEYQPGLEWIVRHSKEAVQILPLAIRIEYRGEQRPEAFFQFGTIFSENMRTYPGMPSLQKYHESLLEDLEHSILDNKPGQVIFSGRRSIHKWFGME